MFLSPDGQCLGVEAECYGYFSVIAFSQQDPQTESSLFQIQSLSTFLFPVEGR